MTPSPRLVSDTHHRVYYDAGAGCFRKVPRVGGEHEVLAEAAVWQAVGMPAHLEGDTLVTQPLGDPVVIDGPFWGEAAIHLVSLWGRLRAPTPGMPVGLGQWHEKTVEKIHRRCTDPDRALSLLPPPDPSAADTPPGLAHADAQPRNWVRDDHGVLHLLDWESACWGPVEVSLAGLAHGAVLAGDCDQVAMLRSHAQDRAVFDWCLRVKAASAFSWAVAHDPTTVEARWGLLEEAGLPPRHHERKARSDG